MSALLDTPPVEDTTILDETVLDDTLMCVNRDGPAEWIVSHKCCANTAFGCTKCKVAWEAVMRPRFALVGDLYPYIRCARCHASHETFESAFDVRPI